MTRCESSIALGLYPIPNVKAVEIQFGVLLAAALALTAPLVLAGVVVLPISRNLFPRPKGAVAARSANDQHALKPEVSGLVEREDLHPVRRVVAHENN